MKKTEPEIKELSEFLAEFNGESDRGAVLTAGAYLDERLGEMLKAFFAEVKETDDLLFGFNAPIGTYSARIKAAYSLGLIQDNEFSELNIIRKIRNEFGHSWKGVSFKTQKIIDLCNNLPWLGPEEHKETSDAKARFSAEVAILLSDFLWRVRLIKNEQRDIKEWSHKMRS
ncbi:MltR family transcriptional regulator [Thiohalophilus sp.]|uniref:MltR family transcriptional regulator n=1 Tax=Thiohalophilus sp. TaxID=3028392 RepID=UPI002ACD893B|nr:MltR family transcriptional regulator [Thiohalophilus sp.]MDZ7661394.1 MltR family transcriptional regulator [Thiohalophilus sp.]